MIAVIGSGIGGLCCTDALISAGKKVLVLDKASSVGGRMATRQKVISGHTQFINTAANNIEIPERLHKFRQILRDTPQLSGTWTRAEYHDVFQPQSSVNLILNDFAKRLSKKGARFVLDEEILSVAALKGSRDLKITNKAQQVYVVSGVISTAPVPQSCQMLKNFHGIVQQCQGIAYHRGLVLLQYACNPRRMSQHEIDRHIIQKVVQQDGLTDAEPMPVAIHATTKWANENYERPDSWLIEQLKHASGFLQDCEAINELKRWVCRRNLYVLIVRAMLDQIWAPCHKIRDL